MFQNVSCTVNNVSFMARPDEVLSQINRMTIPNKVAGKIGLSYPTYDAKRTINNRTKRYCDGDDRSSSYDVPSDFEWKAYEKWRKQATQNETAIYNSARDVGQVATP